MDSRKRAIEQIDQEIARLEQQITSECVAIGKRISSACGDDVAHPELRKYLINIRTLRNSVRDLQAEVSRVEDLDRRLQEREGEVRGNERRVRELNRERDAKLGDLGAGAYALYKTIEDRAPYSTMFDEVLKLDAAIDERSSELASLAEEEKKRGFFGRLRLKAKKVSVRGAMNKLEKKKRKAYEEAGARVADSDFAELTSGELRSKFDFAAGKRRAVEDLHGENDRLRDQVSTIRAELKRVGALDSLPEWRAGMQKRSDEVNKELEVMFCWVGQLYVERDLRAEVPDQGVAAKFDIIAGRAQSIRKRREQIHKLRAELELEELQKRQKDLEARSVQLEEERRMKEKHIRAAEQETESNRKRMEQLRRVLAGEIPYTDSPTGPPPPPGEGG